MEHYQVFPNQLIVAAGPIAGAFIDLGVATFLEACRYVNELPYGYNTDRDDLMILFKEKMGSCTTKHAVIATLATELEIAIEKNIGIYALTERIVTGTDNILDRYQLPYLPMVHCFLVYQYQRVDLTEGNRNEKNCAIDDFLHTEKVTANISGKDEYLLYRRALKDHVMTHQSLHAVDIKTVLKAREEGLSLLRSIIQ